MSDEYVRKQDALNEISCDITITGKENAEIVCKTIASFADGIKAIPAADVAPVQILKAEIYKLKCQQDSKNQDYYTGYMSALSTVEGILAEMREE